MSEITCTPSVVEEVAKGLEALSQMAAEYTSFSVSVGASMGFPAEALEKAAQSVVDVANAEKELIDKTIDNIVADMADYLACDEEAARVLLGIGG